MRLKTAYNKLLSEYGAQKWWPGDTSFEVMVGAILTQNTSWTNVEKAITNLKSINALNAKRILTLPHERLAKIIRPSGYFNVKAKRLRNFCEWYVAEGEYDTLKRKRTVTLRESLLAINGVGPETADDILLYAFNRKVFVIDAYTKRIFSRIGVINKNIGYEELRGMFEKQLNKESAKMFNQYHALIVLHGKDVCKSRPVCEECCLKKSCNASGF